MMDAVARGLAASALGPVTGWLDRQPRITGDQNYRDFWNALQAFNQSEDGSIVIASYGDSVSADVAQAFADWWARQIGFVNKTSWTPVEMANAMPTPTGTEPSGRWPGTNTPYTLAGGATYNIYNSGDTTLPTYVPNADQRWIVPTGGTVTFGTGGDASEYTFTVFLAKEDGAGTCTVDLIDGSSNVLQTQSVDCSNASLACTHVSFTNSTQVRAQLRVTGDTGSVTVLGCVIAYRRGVTMLAWRWGGSTFIQQDNASKTIFDYINSTLGTSIVFVETKGETSSEGIVDGVDGLNLATIRLNALDASKVYIGSRPDNSTEAYDYDQINRYRDYAKANDYVFVDAYNILKDWTEVTRLKWNQKNGVADTTHLPLITAYYIAGYMISRFPMGAFLRNVWETRKVFSSKVLTSDLRIIDPQYASDETKGIRVAYPYGNTKPYANVENVASLKMNNPNSSATATFSMSGNQLALNATLAPTSIAPSAQPTASTASAGAGGAVPANVSTFARITINGTIYRVPLFPDA